MMAAQSAVVAVMSALPPCPSRFATTALEPPLLVNNIEPTLNVSAHSLVTPRRECMRGRVALLFSSALAGFSFTGAGAFACSVCLVSAALGSVEFGADVFGAAGLSVTADGAFAAG